MITYLDSYIFMSTKDYSYIVISLCNKFVCISDLVWNWAWASRALGHLGLGLCFCSAWTFLLKQAYMQ